MTDDARKVARVRPWIRRMARIVLPVLLLVGAWQIWDNVEAARLAPFVARMQAVTKASAAVIARGDPNLQPWEQPNNAARFYDAAMATVQRQSWRPAVGDSLLARREVLSRDTASPPAVRDAGMQAIAANEWPLRLIDHGATLPFIPGGRPGASGLQWANMMAVGDAAAHRTLNAVEDGDGDGAVHSLLMRTQLLRTLVADQWGSALVFGSREIEGVVVDTAIAVSWTEPSQGRLDQLDRALDELTPPELLQHVFAEVALFRHGLLRTIAGGREWQVYGPLGRMLRPVAWNHALAVMQYAEGAIGAVSRPSHERLRALSSVDASRPVLPLAGPDVVNGLPALFENLATRALAAQAAILVARVALKLEAARRAGGAFPPTLDAVGLPAEFVDPFTGELFRYARRDAGYVLYSVGPNGRDDQGAIDPQAVRGIRPGSGGKLDVGVRVYRRAASTSPSNSGRNSPVR